MYTITNRDQSSGYPVPQSNMYVRYTPTIRPYVIYFILENDINAVMTFWTRVICDPCFLSVLLCYGVERKQQKKREQVENVTKKSMECSNMTR